ncbi:MAG: RNA polymerase sigma factor [Acidimicrobiia bacterium]
MDGQPGSAPGARRSGGAEWPPGSNLVALAIEGDRASLTELVEAGYPRLMAFYIGIGLDRYEAEELAAETCEAVVGRISRLRAAQAFEAWFWSIARNRLRTLFRRRRSAKPTDAMISPSTPEELSIEGEEHRRIRLALTKLSIRDRELLWLREVEELEYEELATRLGTTVGAVRVACHRARHRLESIYLSDE